MAESAAKNPKTALRALLGILVAVIVAYGLFVRVAYNAPEPGTELSLDRLFRAAESGQVMSATLLDQDSVVVGQLCLAGVRGTSATGVTCPDRPQRFHATYPASDVGTQQLIERLGTRAQVKVDRQSEKAIAKLLMSFVLPLILLATLFGIIMVAKGGDSSMADIAGFGRLGKKRQREKKAGTGVTFADVAGQDTAVLELREVIDYLKDPAKFEAVGAIAPKGVLLFGPPGCGKTLMARAVAGESGVPFVSVSGTEFVESLVGVGAARVRDLFAQVRELAPAIVFIDEIDAVGRRREGEGVSGGEREQTLNQLLVEMDGFEVAAGVVLIAATNRPDILDSALLRPGRFDRQITLEAPDLEGRKAILAVHAANRNVAPDVDFALLARRTPGFTGADLASVMNEAVLLAIRDGSDEATINSHHLSEAVQRVLHGPHRGKLLAPEERARIAVHESGHAMVAAACGRGADVVRVSVVARGRGVGSANIGIGDRALLTEADIEVQVAIAMGGLAAEEIVYGGSSTMPEDDISRATGLAKLMVGVYGMSDEIGRVQILNRFGGGFLGGDGVSVDSAVSEQMLHSFAMEVKDLVGTAETRAIAILSENRAHLDSMAACLQEEETLEGSHLEEFLAPVVGSGAAAFNGGGPARRDAGSSKSREAALGRPRR
ncbi:MAG TPA: ATP-dependent zinc metalloprotease FtsH [Acidimicrobiales bacterium]|nr:ATP-dependent zinc metalloprotease FtsH [Acidimicrobiales bacterium]